MKIVSTEKKVSAIFTRLIVLGFVVLYKSDSFYSLARLFLSRGGIWLNCWCQEGEGGYLARLLVPEGVVSS